MSGYIVEAFEVYWLSWYMLPSGAEDDLDSCVPSGYLDYHGSMYAQLDECVDDVVVLSVARYKSVTHVNLCFL